MKNQIKFFVIALTITISVRAQNPENNPSSSSCLNQMEAVNGLLAQLYNGQWLRIPFEITGNLNTATVYAEISDAAGSFSNPVVIGKSAIGDKAGENFKGVILATIPENLPMSNRYQIRLVSPNGIQIQILFSDISIKPMNTWFADFDGDGLGDPSKSFISAKASEPGFVQNGSDGDDTVFNATGEITGIIK